MNLFLFEIIRKSFVQIAPIRAMGNFAMKLLAALKSIGVLKKGAQGVPIRVIRLLRACKTLMSATPLTPLIVEMAYV